MNEPRKKHPARDHEVSRTFEFSGPTVWLLRKALSRERLTKADRERVEELRDMFFHSLFSGQPLHTFDHKKKRFR